MWGLRCRDSCHPSEPTLLQYRVSGPTRPPPWTSCPDCENDGAVPVEQRPLSMNFSIKLRISRKMKPAKEIPRSRAVKGYERRPKAWNEGTSRPRRDFSPSPAAEDRNVKRKHCALDFDTLDCPICLESLLPPVYQCQNGHTACGACREMLEKASCPSCSLPIGNNRCIALEKIIESLQVNCKYAEWGCSEMLQYSSKIDEHEALCKFRPYQCPVVDCHYKGLEPGLQQHFLLLHNVAKVSQLFLEDETKYNFTFLTEDGAYDTSRSQYEVLQVFEQDFDYNDDSEDGSLFLLHHQYHEKLYRYSFSCTSFGACKLLTRYRMAVKSKTTGGLKDKHSIEGPIHDNQTDPALLSKIVLQGDCLLVPKLHPAQKDGPQFNVKICFLEADEDYFSDG